VPARLLSSSIEEAKGRWAQKKVVDKSLYPRIEAYINTLPLEPFDREEELPPWPAPNSHACLTHSQKKGGTAMGLIEADRRIRLNNLDFLFTGIQAKSWVEAVTGVFPEDRVEELFDDFDAVADSLDGEAQEPDYARIAGEYLDNVEPVLRPCPIVEMGGKIRVVTLHPAEEVTVARRLTQLWLSRLKKCVTSREMLRGGTVELHTTKRGVKVYSADLSAATDHIDHDLAIFIATLLCNKIGRPHDVPLVRKLLGAKTVENQVGTTGCGIHMGLGPTWVILSLLNGFAAWNAGALKQEYHVCGDDLVGCWKQQTIERYEANLERLGLVVNKSKAFEGRRGVFCEMIVSPTAPGSWRAYNVGHLSEITGAKVRNHFTKNAFAVADHLRDVTVSRAVVDRARRGLVPRSRVAGRVRNGGNGFGSLSNQGLIRILRRPVSLVVAHSTDPDVLDLAHDQQASGDVTLQDALVSYGSAKHIWACFRGEPPATRPITKQEFRRVSRLDHRHATLSQVRDATLLSSLSRRNKKVLMHLLATQPLSPKVRRRLEAVASRRPRERFVSSQDLEFLIKKNFNLEFGRRIRSKQGLTPKTSPTTVPVILVTSRVDPRS